MLEGHWVDGAAHSVWARTQAVLSLRLIQLAHTVRTILAAAFIRIALTRRYIAFDRHRLFWIEAAIGPPGGRRLAGVGDHSGARLVVAATALTVAFAVARGLRIDVIL